MTIEEYDVIKVLIVTIEEYDVIKVTHSDNRRVRCN